MTFVILWSILWSFSDVSCAGDDRESKLFLPILGKQYRYIHSLKRDGFLFYIYLIELCFDYMPSFLIKKSFWGAEQKRRGGGGNQGGPKRGHLKKEGCCCSCCCWGRDDAVEEPWFSILVLDMLKNEAFLTIFWWWIFFPFSKTEEVLRLL